MTVTGRREDGTDEPEHTIVPSLQRLPGERIPEWACACPGLKDRKRHRDPRECLSAHEVAAWRQRHPGERCGEARARVFAWLEQEFGR